MSHFLWRDRNTLAPAPQPSPEPERTRPRRCVGVPHCDRRFGADAIRAPAPLTPAHDAAAFDSGSPALDDGLKRHALDNETTHASRTYIVTAGGRVVGHHALATGAVDQARAPGHVRRHMPDPIPVMIIGRLAVDRAYQGLGIAHSLPRDTILRHLGPARSPASAIRVHAISSTFDEAAA